MDDLGDLNARGPEDRLRVSAGDTALERDCGSIVKERPPSPASSPSSLWPSAAVAGAAAVLALAAVAAHAWLAAGGAYLTPVSGVWLALGRDLSAGIFYRDLVSSVGYGGTRYFPVFFAILGSFLGIGLPPLTAAWLASALSAVVLVSGLYAVVRAIGLPRPAAVLWTSAGVAPYFVAQTLVEVRGDVLAAGLNLLGLASVVRIWPDADRQPVGVAAGASWFTAAFATKITSLAMPVSLFFAMAASGRTKGALRLALAVTAGVVLCVGGIDLLSAGRAVASWRACMFAGVGGSGTVASLLAGSFLQLVRYSHFLVALLAVDVAALVAMFAFRRRQPAHDDAPGWRWLAAFLLLGASLSTAIALSSPGAAAFNHVVEWVEASLVVLALTARARRDTTRAAWAIVAVLVVWAAGQDAIRVRGLARTAADRPNAAARQQVAHLIAGSRRPVLCENPAWPVLAGRQAYVLDPFALRVVMLSRPDVFRDLKSKVESRFFGHIVLEIDPTTPRARGYYEHVHLGWPLMASILANYRLDRQLAPNVWVYSPEE